MRMAPSAFQSVVARNKDAFSKLYYYSIALVVFGLGSFFVTRIPAVSALVVTTRAGQDLLSVVVSLVAVNAVIAVYVYDAFTEPPDPPAAIRSPPPRMPSEDE